jgi:two-component system, chemotaxis family, protein-glutamate methylesterase/glutaminase
MAMSKKITVLIVDDSALIRQMLTTMLSADPQIEVLGAATDPLQARRMIKDLNPDVLTLDVEMPHMDGLAFLEKLMTLRPMPVVMVSSLTQQGADATLRALEIGAVDFVAKPTSGLQAGISGLRSNIVNAVKGAARASLHSLRRKGEPVRRLASATARYDTTEKIIAIGASTGGVGALQTVIGQLPADCPGILVTQHMPAEYTARFADRLNRICAMSIQEASDLARVLPGHVYIAPGGRHLELARSGAHYVCKVHDGPLVSGHRPSVDVLFRSVAEHAARRAVGVILTGMGSDGAEGLLEMRGRGAPTLGECESTCVVYGMPRAAKEAGAVDREFPVDRMAEEILRALGHTARPPSGPSA